MNDNEATQYIEKYFSELYEKRNISILDDYLASNYWDDDIGEEGIDHIENSKLYLVDLFNNHPTICVRVDKVVINNEVITAYLQWYEKFKLENVIIRKGIAIFKLKNGKIEKRHTYIYYEV